MANIQRNGTFSVVPRMPAGEVSPAGLIAIGEVARDYGLYSKVTGGTSPRLSNSSISFLLFPNDRTTNRSLWSAKSRPSRHLGTTQQRRFRVWIRLRKVAANRQELCRYFVVSIRSRRYALVPPSCLQCSSHFVCYQIPSPSLSNSKNDIKEFDRLINSKEESRDAFESVLKLKARTLDSLRRTRDGTVRLRSHFARRKSRLTFFVRSLLGWKWRNDASTWNALRH